ncbi:MAG: DUF2309 domain-containing protein [Pirellulales bacterium]
MRETASLEPSGQGIHQPDLRHDDLRHTIEHLTHLLPSQQPIQVFVHHNTLHAFEDEPFDEAIRRGAATYGCHTYLPEDRYREMLARGRILPHDIAEAMLEDLGEDTDHLIGFLGTRYHLRLAMLQYPLCQGRDSELRWLVAEADAVKRFLPEAPRNVRQQLIAHTRHWAMRDLRGDGSRADDHILRFSDLLFKQFGAATVERWSEATWEAFTLKLLWQICHHGVHGLPQFGDAASPAVRHRDLLLQTTGTDTDRSVNEVLIRFCAAFVDQGLAGWALPDRDHGFIAAWRSLYQHNRPIDRWLSGLPAELERLERAGLTPLEIIEDSLDLLGVVAADREKYLASTILALRGWAGMLWQMETNAEWTVHPAPRGTLIEYVAVRLVLERLAISHAARDTLGDRGDLDKLAPRLRKKLHRTPRLSVDQRAFLVFQLAQYLGWKPFDLHRLSRVEWTALLKEVESFSDFHRRRTYHLAFERRYRNRVLDALVVHARVAPAQIERPEFQVICCLDEREESFRRHLEEVAPECETFGTAGFFGVAMYYRGAADAHYVPLCPVVIKPSHYVQEEVDVSFDESHQRRLETRRALGKIVHRLHVVSRTVFGGALTALFGTLASVPLMARVLCPRLTAKTRRTFGRFVQPPPVAHLLLERREDPPAPQPGHFGYSLDEMVAIARSVLEELGLTRRFARLVLVMGHGSSSVNNPHASAYDCGACGGGRGGPNARAFASILNDPRVREQLARVGLVIPRETIFLGGLHNTCDDSIQYYDLDRLPSLHRGDFIRAKLALDEVRRRNAHERCRRFESADLSLSPEAVLRHVEGRAEDLSQVRSECGHATNATCIVGRRFHTRSLFLDRRAFLTSYDPTHDDAEHSTLTRILQAVFPVCAGINLEYYFSYVDPTGYGCGTKLPHNITSLLGVMDGAASDLRPGLPWQMVEIHEPVRLLFVIETTAAAMLAILERNPGIGRLVHNEWVQLAVLDPDSPTLQIYRRGRFERYLPESKELPVAASSVEWYGGWRDHLGCASIVGRSASTCVVAPKECA